MRKLFILILGILFLSLNLKGSVLLTDSLIDKFIPHDQILDSIKKMETLRVNAPSESLQLGKRVIELARKSEDPSLVGLAEKSQAVSYYYQAVFDSSLIHYERAIAEFDKAGKKIDIGKIYNNEGVIYRRTLRSELALESYLKAQEIYREFNYKEGIASTYLNIGGVYYFLKNFEKAEENFLLSLSLFENLEQGSKYVKVIMNLGALYMVVGEFDKASPYLNQADILCEKYNVNPRDRGDVILNLGELAFLHKEYEKSLEYYKRSEQIRKDINDYWGLPKNYLFTATCLTAMGRYDEALEMLNKSEQICIEYKLVDDLQKCYLQKWIIFEKKGDFKHAFKFIKQQYQITDSIDIQNRSDKLQELKVTQFLDLKEKELAIKNLALSRKNILILSLIVFFLLASVSVLFFLRSRSYRNKLQTLSLEQKVRLSQMNPHFLFNSLTVIQDFILCNENDKAFNYMSKLTGLVRSVLENSTHEYISMREELDILSAYVDLQNLRFDNAVTYRFDIDSEIDLDEVYIPPMLAQPIIENALVHGELRNNPNAEIKICLLKNEENRRIDFTVEDNGIGVFNATHHKGDHRSMATEIIKDRVRIYNYYSKNKLSVVVTDLKTLNEDLHGTRVCFSVPIIKN
ncbi:tetratricopeptide repeat protein [Ancylomarina sp. 16SWW S1-10-2]|uniref:tetratricopeptide repeat-containing sensor histidine kinase n=1 Tax=Ancylomarina sp. 16SWW S1-10-2 TaxID=2499681 RepID=UPI00189E9AB4|nr:tetratricopeptide repeat protein [Ancylomarina sp. 16SWW S1-10-2]